MRYAPPWAIPAISVAVAASLFAFALSGAAYEATTLPGSRVLTRKLESLAAFALVGFLACASFPGLRRPAASASAAVALYSAAIEIGQHLAGSRESLAWNAIDIACGAAGGALGGWIFTRTSGIPAPRD